MVVCVSRCEEVHVQKVYIYIWNIVQQNHPYDTLSNFTGQAKEK